MKDVEATGETEVKPFEVRECVQEGDVHVHAGEEERAEAETAMIPGNSHVEVCLVVKSPWGYCHCDRLQWRRRCGWTGFTTDEIVEKGELESGGSGM